MADAILERPMAESVPPPPDSPFGRPVRLRWIVLLALGIALLARLPYFVSLAAPLNDGGMFAQIVDELRANGLRLPTRTAYNFLDIPLAYPPLGFYAAAIVGNLTGLPSAEVLKGLPLVFNLAAIAAFVALASRLLRSRTAVACAAVLFAILPQSAGWLIMGGGLTRSCGFLFSILATVAAYDALHRGRRRDVVLTGVYAALAGLSHLESGVLVCLVLPLFGLAFLPFRESARRLLPAAGVAVLVALPWVLWLQANVGLEALRNASQTSAGRPFSESLVDTLLGKVLTDRFMGLSVMIVPAMVWAFVRRRWLLPVWIAVVMILVSRSAYTQVTVPATMLAGEAWAAFSAYMVAKKGWTLYPPRVLGIWLLVLIGLAVWTGIDKYIYGYRLPAIKFDVLAALTPTERRAMEWCRERTPPDAKFLVISDRMDRWHMDMVGEWFPYFAQRESVLTVQGREWRPHGEFRRWKEYLETAAEMPQIRQVEAMMETAGIRYDYVYVTGPLYNPRANLARQYSRSPEFELVLDRGTVRVYRAKRLRP
ncbi:MAG: hypothetical protein ACO1SV_20820 [Fimbriimonas sp.]